MKSFLVCAAILLFPFALQEAGAGDNSDTTEALAFQLARFDAMIAADIETLEAMLADDLSYAHTTGWTETKSGFLATVASGKIDYQSVVPGDVAVRVYGDIALMTGTARMSGALDGTEVAFSISFLDVSRRVGDAWQLLAWQSVRLPEAAN